MCLKSFPTSRYIFRFQIEYLLVMSKAELTRQLTCGLRPCSCRACAYCCPWLRSLINWSLTTGLSADRQYIISSVRSSCNQDSRILVPAPAHLSPLSHAAVWIVIKYWSVAIVMNRVLCWHRGPVNIRPGDTGQTGSFRTILPLWYLQYL